MKKGIRIRITLQVLIYALSHGILILSPIFPNDLIGIIVISFFIGLSTYFLWNKTSKKNVINTIVFFIVFQFFRLMGGEGVDISQKSSFYFSTLVNWLLPFIMMMVLIFLLIKILIYKKTTEVPENDVLKKNN
jgi:hypothetical protein